MERCPICDTSFEKKVWNQKFCSEKCKRSIKTECSNCSALIIRYKGNRKHYYCSRKCSEFHNGRALKRNCKLCGDEFTIKQSAVRFGYGVYCSNACQNESMRGSKGFESSSITPKLACCEWCGNMFDILSGSKERYCSKDCANNGYRKWIDKDLLIGLYTEKELTTREIGRIIGRDKKVVLDYLRYHNIEVRPDGIKNRKRILCDDGHEVRSYYERAFDNYLYKLGIEHEHDVRLPFDKRYMTDFKVGDVYVEIWGMMGWKTYEERRLRKLDLYRENNCTLLEVFPEDFKNLEVKINELKRLIS